MKLSLKKQEFLEQLKDTDAEQVTVIVTVPDSVLPNYIINLKQNFKTEFEHYNNEYNDDLELEFNKVIKILEWQFNK